MNGTPLLRLDGVEKTYSNGVRAVRGVDLSVAEGEIHSVVGENGAGKSTLMKLVYGLETPTGGRIEFAGERVRIDNTAAALALGIGMVHQNLLLVPSFTMAENIVLGAEPGSRRWIDRREAARRVSELAASAGLPIDPDLRAADASVGVRQRAAILKSLGRGARLLILDEPTAVLTPQETDELFAAIRRLRDAGLTVVLISHKLGEVRSISDRISVMRQGTLIATHATADTTEECLATEMVGRTVSLDVRAAVRPRGDALLRLEDVTIDRRDRPPVGPISFAVRAGEIVGIAGIDGGGQTELMRSIAGQLDVSAGRILIGDEDLVGRSVRARRAAGLSIVSEDRLTDGAAADLSILDNLIVDRHHLPPVGRRGRLRPRVAARHADELMREYLVKAPDARVPMQALSGGNMQKVIVARELSAEPKVLLASQPTRGVDIGAKEFIYARIADARDRGTAVLVVSADLTEVINLSDRLLVIRDGAIVAEFDDTDGRTEQVVGRFMLGVEGSDLQSDGALAPDRELEPA